MAHELVELREDALTDFFKRELNSLQFISHSDHEDIGRNLEIIADRNAQRHRIVEATQWLWEYMVKASLNDITSNLRGYDELCEYFERFVEYENLLLAVDENHRDHAIHSIWVMILGFYLMKNFILKFVKLF